MVAFRAWELSFLLQALVSQQKMYSRFLFTCRKNGRALAPSSKKRVPFESHMPRNCLGAVVEQSGQRQVFDVPFGFLLHQCNRCHLFGTCGLRCSMLVVSPVQRPMPMKRTLSTILFCYLFVRCLTYIATINLNHCAHFFFRCCG